MGLTAQSLKLIVDFCYGYSSMYELGSQQVFFCPPYKDGIFAKELFPNYEHVSIDINGEGNSLELDLNEELNLKPLDIVTDFGTLEHVEDLYMGWKNAHNLCRFDGIMIHTLPALENWKGHGTWRMEDSFFSNREFLRTLGYKVLLLSYEKMDYGGEDSNQIFVVYKKTKFNVPFINREIFENLGIVRVGNEKYKKGIGRIL